MDVKLDARDAASTDRNRITAKHRGVPLLSKNQLKALHGKDYVESFETGQSGFRLERLIRSIDFSTGSEVIDVGCGNGMLLPLLADRVKRYTGVDFSEEFIKAAERKKKGLSISNADFVCADISQYCEEKRDSYDIAFAMDLSEHVYDEEWVNILMAIHYSLKDGGKLYIHTPNSEFILEIMKSYNFIIKQFPAHIAVRNLKENCALLNRAGFTVGKVSLIPHYNILKFLHPLSFIPVVGKFFKARIFIESIVDRDDNQAS